MIKNTKSKKIWTITGWFLFVFLFGCVCGFVIGYGLHYYKVNQSAFNSVCEDGTKPDIHGCCKGELYMDAGDGWMVCCPDGGDHCYPPMFQPIR